MKTIFTSLATAVALTVLPAAAQDAQGYWAGSIANTLPVVVQFAKTADGKWEATLSAPSQNSTSKVEDVVVTLDHVSFALPKYKASYSATWNAQDQAWTGTWMQGRAAPLVLKRTTRDAVTARRPQEESIAASAPPYASTDVSIDHAGVTLAGTLTIPAGKGPFPAVVLVHGSGPNNRDEDIFGHKPFLVLADYLTRQGIAVLRYDKRGIGKSTGDLKAATMPDLADDAAAAVRFLRTRPEVDTRHIGIVGHSEGGLIAPLVATRDPALAFVVMLAGPGVRGDQLLVEQLALNAKGRGVPEPVIARERLLHQTLFAAMLAAPDLDGARHESTRILDDAERKGDLPAGASKAMVERFGNAWFLGLLKYEPAPVLQALRQPVLVLNGARDQQVPAAMDLDAIRAALKDNPRAVVREMPDLNHLFQTAPTGAVGEYGTIAETFAPAALAAIGQWIAATVR